MKCSAFYPSRGKALPHVNDPFRRILALTRTWRWGGCQSHPLQQSRSEPMIDGSSRISSGGLERSINITSALYTLHVRFVCIRFERQQVVQKWTSALDNQVNAKSATRALTIESLLRADRMSAFPSAMQQEKFCGAACRGAASASGEFSMSPEWARSGR